MTYRIVQKAGLAVAALAALSSVALAQDYPTKPITLNATLNQAGPHPFTKKPAVGFSATATIKRSDFGISEYVPAISDEVTLRIEIEASAS